MRGAVFLGQTAEVVIGGGRGAREPRKLSSSICLTRTHEAYRSHCQHWGHDIVQTRPDSATVAKIIEDVDVNHTGAKYRKTPREGSMKS